MREALLAHFCGLETGRGGQAHDRGTAALVEMLKSEGIITIKPTEEFPLEWTAGEPEAKAEILSYGQLVGCRDLAFADLLAASCVQPPTTGIPEILVEALSLVPAFGLPQQAAAARAAATAAQAAGEDGDKFLLQAFASLDADRSGSIDADEFAKLCKKLDPKTTEAKTAAALQEIDADGDGEVSAEEFVAWWRRSHPVSSAGIAVEPTAVTPDSVAQLMAVLLPYHEDAAKLPSLELVINSCRALRAVAAMGPGFRDRIVSGGKEGGHGLQLLLHWLRRFRMPQPVTAICLLLRELCADSSAAVGLLEAAHGLELLIHVIENVAFRRDAISAAVEALTACLAASPMRTATCRTIINSGGFRALVLALQRADNYSDSMRLVIRLCSALFLLTAADNNKVTACEQGVLEELIATLSQAVKERHVKAIEYIGAMLVSFSSFCLLGNNVDEIHFLSMLCSQGQLSEGPSASNVAELLLKDSVRGGGGGLQLLRRACGVFPDEVTIQRVMIVIIAGVSISPNMKQALVKAGLLDRIIVAMNKFKNHAELQEQGCRGVMAVSKGVEEVKSYLADRQDDLQVIEAIHSALKKFHSSATLVEAGCSAVWSVSFKNVRMKNRAGDVGVFSTLIDLIREHTTELELLPHAFVAIGNLSANHAVNQALCGQLDVVGLCLEMLPEHAAQINSGGHAGSSHSTICYTILSCLNATLSDQSDNTAKFVEAGGSKLVNNLFLQSNYAREVSTSSNRKLAAIILEGVQHQAQSAKAKEAARAKQASGAAGQLEAREANRDPLGTLPLATKATVLKQGRCLVRYRKNKGFGAKTVFLLEHELKIFQVQATDYKRPDAVLLLPLVTAVKKVEHSGGAAVLLQLRLSEYSTVTIQPAGHDCETECEKWYVYRTIC
eukprot:SAG31_NODE_5193_length_2689_cov_1.305019_1_plen_896_part_11